MQKFWEKVKEGIDVYGEPIGIKFKGKGTYTTTLGTWLTLFTAVLCIYYTWIKGDHLINK
jgi:hypothetical protein